MTRRLYDLAAADETVRFSPYCWRTKLALAHKNLTYETVPWHFTDKEAIAFTGQGMVPVLVDGEHVIADSQAIAEYLEDAYPNEASLYGEAPARALTWFIKSWAETILHPAIALVAVPDIHAKLAVQDKDYFRETREARFGCSLEELAARRPEALKKLQSVLKPLHATLEAQPFISGETPSYADHIVFGALQWGRTMSGSLLLEHNELLVRWMEAVLATYGL